MSQLVPGSIINVHLTNGSATGGIDYAGVDVFTGAEQRTPELVGTGVASGEQVRVKLDEIAFVDTLAVPFTVQPRAAGAAH